MSFTYPNMIRYPINPDVVVQDNFMSDDYCEQLCEIMASERYHFPWYYGRVLPYNNDTKYHCEDIAPPLNNFQFSHRFWSNGEHESNEIDIIKPVLDKIDPDVLYRVKANLNPVAQTEVVHGYHTDVNAPGHTSILYLNTNNGKTRFKYINPETQETHYQEVESIKGRLVTFDNRNQHSGTTCSDQTYRLVLNINYYKHSLL